MEPQGWSRAVEAMVAALQFDTYTEAMHSKSDIHGKHAEWRHWKKLPQD